MKSRQGKTFASRTISQCVKMVIHRLYKLRRCKPACQSQQALRILPTRITPESRITKRPKLYFRRVTLSSFIYVCFNHVKT
jgi:hypothetical protein